MTRFSGQGREDKICLRLFRALGVRSRCAVEFGAWDGIYKSNTAYFRQVLGWRVILLDAIPRAPIVAQATITAENVNEVFRAHDVPDNVDLVSIDIDGNDLWVWKALTYQPSIVIIEYNPRWASVRRRTVPYDPARVWDGSDYYGASAGALVQLGEEKGYRLTASTEYNLIFTRGRAFPVLPVAAVKRRRHQKILDPLARPWVGY